MLTVGSLVAGYRVERVLGSGGMGAVYLVANPELPRREALKLLSAELSRDQGFRARFIREAAVAARLEHPNIVSIYRRGETADGQLWIAMQFIDGTDADEPLQRGTMTPERAIHIVGEVAKALDYAHGHNVIHRDVKPANFLLSGPAGPDERVWLADFGIARAYDDASITGTGEMMATVSYAAPEVIAGDPVGSRADQYSLGCSLFRLLTGRAPFAGVGAQTAVMMAHLGAPPPRVSEQVPGLSPALDHVLATALAKNPDQRFASCTDFAAAARAALHQPMQHGARPVFSAPPSQHPTLTTHARRRRGTIAAALTGVVVIAAATTALIAWPSRESGSASTTTTTTAAATATAAVPQPTIISATQLTGLLLSADELGGIMTPPVQADPIRESMWDDRYAIAAMDCLSAWTPAQTATYDGSRWTGIRAQILKQPAVVPDGASATQAVITFPNQDLAKTSLLSQTQQWKRCAGRPYTVNTASGAQSWAFGKLQDPTSDGLYSITSTMDGGSTTCERVLTMRNNVIVDILDCRPLSTVALQIARKIAANVPQ